MKIYILFQCNNTFSEKDVVNVFLDEGAAVSIRKQLNNIWSGLGQFSIKYDDAARKICSELPDSLYYKNCFCVEEYVVHQ